MADITNQLEDATQHVAKHRKDKKHSGLGSWTSHEMSTEKNPICLACSKDCKQLAVIELLVCECYRIPEEDM